MASTLSRPGSYWRSVAAGLASGPGGSIGALRWLAMYGLARFVVVREIARMGVVREIARLLMPRRIAAELRASRDLLFDPGEAASLFDAGPAAVAGIVEGLRRDGFDARLRLPAPIVAGLASFSGSGSTGSVPYSGGEPSCHDPAEPIAADPILRRIAGLYLGAPPVYQGSRLWWTRPGELGDPLETGARFHFDLYDYRSLTFLFYLTGVDADTAPHVCVRASHRRRRWRDQLHLRRHRSDEWIARLYGDDRTVTICGPAGTGIAEDPFCFHKVKLPAKRARLALQLLFTGRDVPAPSFRREAAPRPEAAPRLRGTG